MGFFDKLFGSSKYKNPADSAMPYLNQIPGQTMPYMTPYFQAGLSAIPNLQTQLGALSNNPGGILNNIGQSFQQSPGFKFALQQALEGAGHAAAAGGMAGTPQHEQQNMQLATDLANQDYYNWLGQATGLYGKGLAGEEGLAGMGQQAGTNMADMIAQQLAQQAQLAYTGQQNQNQQNSSFWGNIGKGIGALSAFTPWANAGNAIGKALGG